MSFYSNLGCAASKFTSKESLQQDSQKSIKRVQKRRQGVTLPKLAPSTKRHLVPRFVDVWCKSCKLIPCKLTCPVPCNKTTQDEVSWSKVKGQGVEVRKQRMEGWYSTSRLHKIKLQVVLSCVNLKEEWWWWWKVHLTLLSVRGSQMLDFSNTAAVSEFRVKVLQMRSEKWMKMCSSFYRRKDAFSPSDNNDGSWASGQSSVR